jgi:hypothetical protein
VCLNFALFAVRAYLNLNGGWLLWRAELRRVEKVLNARLKLLEER